MNDFGECERRVARLERQVAVLSEELVYLLVVHGQPIAQEKVRRAVKRITDSWEEAPHE